MTGYHPHKAAHIPFGWWENARCKGVTIRGVPFDEVNRKREIERARAVCDECPVQRQCLQEAMALEAGIGREYRFGFRAGLTRRERHLLNREAS